MPPKKKAQAAGPVEVPAEASKSAPAETVRVVATIWRFWKLMLITGWSSNCRNGEGWSKGRCANREAED